MRPLLQKRKKETCVSYSTGFFLIDRLYSASALLSMFWNINIDSSRIPDDGMEASDLPQSSNWLYNLESRV